MPWSAARAVALATLLVATPAAANSSWQGVGALSAGWNSNVNGAAFNSGLVLSDGTGTAALGVIFASALPRIQQIVSYNFAAALFFSTPEATSYSNALSWLSLVPTSPTTTMRFGLSLLQSQANAITSLPASSATPIAVTTISSAQFISGALTENLVWETSANTRLGQNLVFNVQVPLDAGAGQVYTLDQLLRVDRLWRKDAFGGQLHLNFTDYTAAYGPRNLPDGSVDANTVIAPEQRVVTFDFILRWRRDFGHFWNSELNAGVMLVFVPSSGADAIVQPTGLAALRYLHPNGQAELSYSHAAAPNALTQQTYISDLVQLHALLPFGLKNAKLSASASAGYTHSQALDRTFGGLGSVADLVLADGSLNWSPRSGLTLFVRYQYTRQFGGPLSDPTAIPSLERHVALAGISGIYPTTTAAVVPNHDALRVDGSDVEPPPQTHAPEPSER